MTTLLTRSSAALLIAATALTAACSNNDPMAPAAPSAARTPASATPVHASGYLVGWGKDGGGAATGTTPTSAPTVGKPGTVGIGAGNIAAPTPTSGYLVGWGKDASNAP